MKATIDRFEDGYAVLELPDMTMVNVARKLIPGEAKEGSVLDISIEVDYGETAKKAERISGLMNSLFKD